MISSITIPTETSKGLMQHGALMSTSGHLSFQNACEHGWETSPRERQSRHKHPILYRTLTCGNKPRTICITEECSAGHSVFLMTGVVKMVPFSPMRPFYMCEFVLIMIKCGNWLWRFLYHLLLESPSNLFIESSQVELFSIVMSLQL